MDDNLSDFKVTDRQSFIKFLNLLHRDLIDNPDRWENDTLARFLESMVAYTADLQGYYNNTGQYIDADRADWKTFADILKGAGIYE